MSIPLAEKPNAEDAPTFNSVGVIINGHYAPPPQEKEGKIWVRTSALIQASPQELYNIWRNLELIPTWQEEIESVVSTGEKTSHWVLRSGDKTIEWDSEILADEPGKRVAWRSIGGELENAGEVIFEPAPANRGTVATVLQEFRVGKIAIAWETFVGRNPKQAVIENLRHFKAFAETGEIPRVQGSPHGARGVIGGMKESMYGEKIPTPPGPDRPTN